MMGAIDIVLLAIAAWFPAGWLARKWQRGALVPIAVIVGTICGVAVMFGVGYATHTLNPETHPAGEAILKILTSGPIAMLIAVAAGVKGWRDARVAISEGGVREATTSPKQEAPPPPARTTDLVEEPTIRPSKVWWRGAMIVWAILSVAWIGFLGEEAWEHRHHVSGEPEPVTEVTIRPDFTASTGEDVFDVFDREHEKSMRVSVEKSEPGSDVFRLARKNFAEDVNARGLNDEEFAEFIWEKVLSAKHFKEEFRQRRIDIANARASNLVTLGLIGPLALFGLMRFGRWHLGRFPPAQYSIHVRRGLAIATMWMMGAVTWAFIEEGDLYYALSNAYFPLFFAPPLVIVVSFLLWSWANKSKG